MDYNPSLLFKQPGRSEQRLWTFLHSPSDNQRPSRKIQLVVVGGTVIFSIAFAVLPHSRLVLLKGRAAILEQEGEVFP